MKRPEPENRPGPPPLPGSPKSSDAANVQDACQLDGGRFTITVAHRESRVLAGFTDIPENVTGRGDREETVSPPHAPGSDAPGCRPDFPQITTDDTAALEVPEDFGIQREGQAQSEDGLSRMVNPIGRHRIAELHPGPSRVTADNRGKLTVRTA